MRFIFCADPLEPGIPDSAYADEIAAVMEAGIDYDLIHFERLVHDQNPPAATRRVRAAEQPELAIYRGWMLRSEQYRQLYDALQSKGLLLINSPAAYRHCHELPESYPIIHAVTPQTVWLPYDANFTIDRVMSLLAPFGDQAVILKDYVKSHKHDWHEACYIPRANDRAHVERVVTRFLELQADDLNEGLVFREYIPFQQIGNHTKSGMPLTLEYRCFVLDGTVFATSNYWEEGTYPVVTPPIDRFSTIMQNIQSRFFTMDIAQRTDGAWMIVEVGDAQVAGIPETLDSRVFYQSLLRQLPRL